MADSQRAARVQRRRQRAVCLWLESTASLIKSIDPNHLVSVGSEGSHGCEADLDLWARMHESDNIDYGTLHLWPYNWGWVNEGNLAEAVDSAAVKAREYIGRHSAVMARQRKPMVLEEFGYPRDGFVFAKGTPTSGRDRFYGEVFDMVAADSVLAGCNFWGWGGEAEPAHETWLRGDAIPATRPRSSRVSTACSPPTPLQ